MHQINLLRPILFLAFLLPSIASATPTEVDEYILQYAAGAYQPFYFTAVERRSDPPDDVGKIKLASHLLSQDEDHFSSTILEAARLYELAASHGNPIALFMLGTIYFEGNRNILPNPRWADELFEASEVQIKEDQTGIAAKLIGESYLYGNYGFPMDLEQAEVFLSKSLVQNNRDPQTWKLYAHALIQSSDLESQVHGQSILMKLGISTGLKPANEAN